MIMIIIIIIIINIIPPSALLPPAVVVIKPFLLNFLPQGSWLASITLGRAECDKPFLHAAGRWLASICLYYIAK